MDKDRQTLSATELSKFSYCPYQWYYERLYGRKELRRLEVERNERLGLADSRKERMEAGNAYHKNAGRNIRRRRIMAVTAIVIMTAVLLYLLAKGGVL